MKTTGPRESALKSVRQAFPDAKPVCGLMLGSGWSALSKMFNIHSQINYNDVPGLGATTVKSHTGTLALGEAAGLTTLIFQGRHHWYENRGWDPVLLPVWLCREMGARVMVLTNAAGGIRQDLQPGDLMLISDHINAMGVNPLTARMTDGRRNFFVDQTAIYDSALRRMASAAATQAGLRAADGVYLAVSGPNYETPAEIRMYRAMGADAIGMSTVPEAMTAHALGLRLLGLSCITNPAAGLHGDKLSHDEVTASAGKVLPGLRKMLTCFWSSLAKSNP
ncbi:MAG: purine-nucleoside phosphorylase [Kiritimatiellia bacterium]